MQPLKFISLNKKRWGSTQTVGYLCKVAAPLYCSFEHVTSKRLHWTPRPSLFLLSQKGSATWTTGDSIRQECTWLGHEFLCESQSTMWPHDGKGCDMTMRDLACIILPSRSNSISASLHDFLSWFLSLKIHFGKNVADNPTFVVFGDVWQLRPW